MTIDSPARAQISAEEAAAVMAALPSVDWSDFEAAAVVSQRIVRELGENRPLLRALVERAKVVPELRAKCEIHTMDDKIVIWDEPDRGLRIRLRLSNTDQYERIHNHRFHFTAQLLHGAYHHTLFATDQPLDEHADVERFWPRWQRDERTGDAITLHHEQLHITLTDPDTISLMIQSPAQKRRAFIIRKSDGEVWWRLGQADEDEKRRAEVHMSDERLAYWSDKLSALGVC